MPWGRPRTVSVSAIHRRAVAAPKDLQTGETQWMQKGREGWQEGAGGQSRQPETPQPPAGVYFLVSGVRLKGPGREQGREPWQDRYGQTTRKGVKAGVSGFPLHFSPRATWVLAASHCV